MLRTVKRNRLILLTAAFALVMLNVAIFWRRAASLFGAYDLIGGEGAEVPTPDPIWRLLPHFPLYAIPTRPPFALTLYNYGFYYCYAGLLWVFGIDGLKILLV